MLPNSSAIKPRHDIFHSFFPFIFSPLSQTTKKKFEKIVEPSNTIPESMTAITAAQMQRRETKTRLPRTSSSRPLLSPSLSLSALRCDPKAF
jgi:hypothetical protein